MFDPGDVWNADRPGSRLGVDVHSAAVLTPPAGRFPIRRRLGRAAGSFPPPGPHDAQPSGAVHAVTQGWCSPARAASRPGHQGHIHIPRPPPPRQAEGHQSRLAMSGNHLQVRAVQGGLCTGRRGHAGMLALERVLNLPRGLPCPRSCAENAVQLEARVSHQLHPDLVRVEQALPALPRAD
jgi:hypothetical protein